MCYVPEVYTLFEASCLVYCNLQRVSVQFDAAIFDGSKIKITATDTAQTHTQTRRIYGVKRVKTDGFIKVHPSVHSAHAIENENSDPEAFCEQCISNGRKSLETARHAHNSRYVFTASSPPFDPIV